MISAKPMAMVAMLALAGAAAAQDKPKEPRQLTIGPEGVRFRVEQHTSVSVPGSHGWVEVFLDDITRGQVLLGIRTAEGLALVSPLSVAEGDVVAFRAGESDYAIRVDRLRNRLIGADSAELYVAVAQDPPTDQRIFQIVQELQQVEQHIQSARAFMEEGKLAEADTALQEAHRSLTAVKLVLGYLDEGRNNQRVVAEEEESRFEEWAILVGIPVGWVLGAKFRDWLDKHPDADATFQAVLRQTRGRRR